MQISLSQALQDCNAELVYDGSIENIYFDGAASDNRQVQKNNLFVCIRGENHDGHDFAQNAAENGAAVILAERNPFPGTPPVPVLLVKDSVKALGLLARHARLRFGQDPEKKVIGITGTAGKTSVKELLAHLLSMDENFHFHPERVAKNPLNLNTQIGMPVSLLNAKGTEKYWVFELGISHAQDMDELGRILLPDMAIILNAASGHTEGLGDYGVAYYKAQLLNFLPPQGIAYVSADYPDLFVHAVYNKKDTRFFSTQSGKIPFQGKYLGLSENGMGKYLLKTPSLSFEAESIYIGEYGAENCIAVTGLALELGFSAEQIQYALKTVQPPKMRFNRLQKNDWTVIDDTYNANPLSAARMLKSAKELAKGTDFVVVLGEMKELGAVADEEHENIGALLAELNPEAVFFVGGHANSIKKGLDKKQYAGIFLPVADKEEFIGHLRGLSLHNPKHLIVFKGSRSNRLDEYVNFFMEQDNAL